MVKEWEGPTEESIAAENGGYALRARLQRIEKLKVEGDVLDWQPRVDVFDKYRTALEIRFFGRDSGFGVLDGVAETLVALGLVPDRKAVKVARDQDTSGWILSLPVENVDQVVLDRLAPPDGAAPKLAKPAALKLKL